MKGDYGDLKEGDSLYQALKGLDTISKQMAIASGLACRFKGAPEKLPQPSKDMLPAPA